MKNRFISLLLILVTSGSLGAQQNVSGLSDPLEVIKLIGDKLIRDTPFQYRLTTTVNDSKFNGLHFVDFGRTFGLKQSAVAFALTKLTVRRDTSLTIQTAHNDGCKIWVNGNLVYEKHGKQKLDVRFEERSVEMAEQFTVHLKKGDNSLLVKSETYGSEWIVFLQPPSLKGAVFDNSSNEPVIGIQSLPNVDQKIAALTNWLVIGPFANPEGKGIDIQYAPEKELIFGKMYEGADCPVTWTIPKIEILGDVIDPLPWGTNYTWNYHNGGVAWAMQQLAEVTEDKKYNQYATDFCNFHLNGAAFVDYQVKTLRAVNSGRNPCSKTVGCIKNTSTGC